MCPLFLKDKCISSLFRMKYIEKKFNLSCFFFSQFHKHLFSPGLPGATCLLETSCLEKITVCVIETMLVTLLLVQMNKARREVNRTNHVQTKINVIFQRQLIAEASICGSFLWNLFWKFHKFPRRTFPVSVR